MPAPRRFAPSLFSIALALTVPCLLFAQPDADFTSELPAVQTIRLENGVRVVLLPPPPGSDLAGWTDVAFGYTFGVRDEVGYPSGTARVVARYFSVSPSARAVAIIAHLSGGSFEFVEEPDRVGMRVRVPTPLLPGLMAEVRKYFRLSSVIAPLNYAHDLIREEAPDVAGYRAEIEREIRSALLGERPYVGSVLDRTAVDRIEYSDLTRFIADHIFSNRMYVIVSGPMPDEAEESLARIRSRITRDAYTPTSLPEDQETRLEFPSEAEGGVVVATALDSVHYESWFMTLVLDRLFGYVLGADAILELDPYLDTFFHRIEIPVGVPESPEGVRDRLLELLDQLRYRPPSPSRLQTLKQEALSYLLERKTLEWFAAHDLWTALKDGWGAIFHMTADDLRLAADGFASARRVIGIWRPVLDASAVTVESLDACPFELQPTVLFDHLPRRISIPRFAPTSMPDPEPVRVEPLPSGVTLAQGPKNALFVAGRFDGDFGGLVASGPNGSLWTFSGVPPPTLWEGIAGLRPDRILVFGPPEQLTALRERLRGRASDTMDSTPSLPAGEVATGDIPSLLILKMWLDARLIEAGGWSAVRVEVDATKGSRLSVDAEPERARQVRSWIDEIINDGMDETEFERVRAAALGYFERIRRDLAILLWQRDPGGAITPPSAVSLARFLEMVRYYYREER